MYDQPTSFSIGEPAFIVTPQQVDVIRAGNYQGTDGRSPDKLWRNSLNTRTNNPAETVLSPFRFSVEVTQPRKQDPIAAFTHYGSSSFACADLTAESASAEISNMKLRQITQLLN